MKLTSIQARLLLGTVGVLFVGFIVLTVIAGEQISSGARADFETRLQNEIRLIGQGLRTSIATQDIESDEVEAVIANYEAQSGGDIRLYLLAEPEQRGGGNCQPPTSSQQFRDSPEIEATLRGEVVVLERLDDQGQPALFTADEINFGERQPRIIVQLIVPLENLQQIIWGRWALLWLLFGAVLIAALITALLLARSIIRPLVALRESAHRLSTGDFSHRIKYTRDDEIGEVAHAFNNMAQQVESMLEEQRAFAANTSHELRTPLTTIRLRSEALRFEEGIDDATAKQYIAEIDDEAQRMGSLIEDLTVLARFDAGRAELGKDSIDFALFATSLTRRMAAQADAKHIRLDLNVTPELPPIRASLTHLTVVFRNLLDNAIKYTPEGGAIIWIVWEQMGSVCSAITDTGSGVEAEQIPHLFERFYRVDKARSRDVPGSGLGLAIVKSILDAYGASIRIESEGKERGTTVRVLWRSQNNGL